MRGLTWYWWRQVICAYWHGCSRRSPRGHSRGRYCWLIHSGACSDWNVLGCPCAMEARRFGLRVI